MELVDALDLGAAVAPEAPCLVMDRDVLSYAEVQGLSRSVAASLKACGVRRGEHSVAVLSANDPLMFSCVLGASRTGARWIAADPSTMPGTADTLPTLGDCAVLMFRVADATLAATLSNRLPRLRAAVCLDGSVPGALTWGQFLVVGLTRGPVAVAEPPILVPRPAPGERPVFLAYSPLAEVSVRCGEVLAAGGVIKMRRSPSARRRIRIDAPEVTPG